MKTIVKLSSLIPAIFLIACSSYERSAEKIETTTNYNDKGEIASVVITETNVKELKEITDGRSAMELLEEADKGTASSRSISYNKAVVGYNDVGLTLKSITLDSTRAPATPASSDSVLINMGEVKKANKTTIQTSSLSVNSDSTPSSVATPKTPIAKTSTEESKKGDSESE